VRRHIDDANMVEVFTSVSLLCKMRGLSYDYIKRLRYPFIHKRWRYDRVWLNL
jgi:hypothetical protein